MKGAPTGHTSRGAVLVPDPPPLHKIAAANASAPLTPAQIAEADAARRHAEWRERRTRQGPTKTQRIAQERAAALERKARKQAREAAPPPVRETDARRQLVRDACTPLLAMATLPSGAVPLAEVIETLSAQQAYDVARLAQRLSLVAAARAARLDDEQEKP